MLYIFFDPGFNACCIHSARLSGNFPTIFEHYQSRNTANILPDERAVPVAPLPVQMLVPSSYRDHTRAPRSQPPQEYHFCLYVSENYLNLMLPVAG